LSLPFNLILGAKALEA